MITWRFPISPHQRAASDNSLQPSAFATCRGWISEAVFNLNLNLNAQPHYDFHYLINYSWDRRIMLGKHPVSPSVSWNDFMLDFVSFFYLAIFNCILVSFILFYGLSPFLLQHASEVGLRSALSPAFIKKKKKFFSATFSHKREGRKEGERERAWEKWRIGYRWQSAKHDERWRGGRWRDMRALGLRRKKWRNATSVTVVSVINNVLTVWAKWTNGSTKEGDCSLGISQLFPSKRRAFRGGNYV